MRAALSRLPRARAAPAAGFCLLENLAALAILTLCLLGTTRLFGEALRLMRDNADRQSAATLGRDITERFASLRNGLTAAAPVQCVVTETRCFNEPPVEAMLAAWHDSLLREIPDARAQVSMTASPVARTFSVRIDWIDSRRQTASQRFERVLRQ